MRSREAAVRYHPPRTSGLGRSKQPRNVGSGCIDGPSNRTRRVSPQRAEKPGDHRGLADPGLPAQQHQQSARAGGRRVGTDPARLAPPHAPAAAAPRPPPPLGSAACDPGRVLCQARRSKYQVEHLMRRGRPGQHTTQSAWRGAATAHQQPSSDQDAATA